MYYEEIRLYEDREDVRLTTYILDDSVEMLNGGKKGAVLICPGGGYLYCSDREGEPVAMAFAAMGYHTFVLRYSVYNENKRASTLDSILPDFSKPLEEKPGVVFPGPVRDIGKAMLYMKEHAADWHIDMEKVALCGFSAGAHNSAMYSVYYNRPAVTDFLGIGAEGIRPAAVILGYMVSDYMPRLSEEAAKNPMSNAMDIALMGRAGVADRELAEKLSPCRLVNDQTPPMFIWTTAEDHLVDPAQSLWMALALNKHKIPYEMHIFEKGMHGMALATYATAARERHLDTDIESWIHMADKWLQKRLAPEFSKDFKGIAALSGSSSAVSQGIQ